MFSADMMGSVGDRSFITYNYAIDSIRGRISAKDVTATIVVENKMVNAEEISEFYAIKKKTAQNRISEMRNNPKFMSGDFFRMNGRVWFPAFDEFIKQRDELKYK